MDKPKTLKDLMKDITLVDGCGISEYLKREAKEWIAYYESLYKELSIKIANTDIHSWEMNDLKEKQNACCDKRNFIKEFFGVE